MPEKYLAFTINQLDGLLETLEKNSTITSNHDLQVSIGLLLKLNRQRAGEPLFPTSINQLIFKVTPGVTGELNVSFREVPAAWDFNEVPYLNAAGVPLVELPIQYTKYKIDPLGSVPYLNRVAPYDENLDFQFAKDSTKAVFFSRTQLLLFKKLLAAGDRSEHDLLFSGWNHFTGKMGAIVNMAEQKRFLSSDPTSDHSNWFALKAELWKKAEAGSSKDVIVSEAEQIITELDQATATSTVRSGLGQQRATKVPSTTPCDGAMFPIAAISQPCPPAWMSSGNAAQEISHYFEGIRGIDVPDTIKKVMCATAEVFRMIGEGHMEPVNVVKFNLTVSEGVKPEKPKKPK